ncbi:MAG: DsrE family protein [Desulfobacterales bacterium]
MLVVTVSHREVLFSFLIKFKLYDKKGLKVMANKLGILVSSNKHLDYVIALTTAAHNKGKSVQIFFTGKGVLLTQKPEFEQLVGKAKLSVCDVSFRANGLSGDVPGVGFKDFATQARNAEMIESCDRYVVF